MDRSYSFDPEKWLPFNEKIYGVIHKVVLHNKPIFVDGVTIGAASGKVLSSQVSIPSRSSIPIRYGPSESPLRAPKLLLDLKSPMTPIVEGEVKVVEFPVPVSLKSLAFNKKHI